MAGDSVPMLKGTVDLLIMEALASRATDGYGVMWWIEEDAGWQRYWRYLTTRFHRDVDDELAFHVDMRAAELQERGLSAEAAKLEAQRRFGDRTRIRATLHRIEKNRGQGMKLSFLFDELFQDGRYGVRGLLKRPGFALMTASSLVLGIAATTVVPSESVTRPRKMSDCSWAAKGAVPSKRHRAPSPAKCRRILTSDLPTGGPARVPFPIL